jgi:hypothetical protein
MPFEHEDDGASLSGTTFNIGAAFGSKVSLLAFSSIRVLPAHGNDTLICS